ncbi:MAG TPA: ABC transporter ATP-binding protein [Aestuariivirgaceae bacterium]|nr:ABC transporter ATP-binding protein [Aestuariivirgaceae bacterium]
MVEPILKTQHLWKRFGALTVAEDVSIDLRPDEIHALIGPNGAGKTSLAGLISGHLAPDKGHVFFEGANITNYKPAPRALLGMARTTQLTSIFRGATVLANTILAFEAANAHSLKYFGRVTDSAVDAAMAALHEVGLGEQGATPASALSYGEQRRLELAMALVTAPVVLILDEPMAGTSPDETQSLTRLLKSLKQHCAILLIEHDMTAVFALADRISVMVSGRILASGLPEIIKANADVQTAYLGRDKEPEHA